MALTNPKIGDKVVHSNDPSYTGIITKLVYVPKKGLTFGNFWWIYLDGSSNPAGSDSTKWNKVD